MKKLLLSLSFLTFFMIFFSNCVISVTPPFPPLSDKDFEKALGTKTWTNETSTEINDSTFFNKKPFYYNDFFFIDYDTNTFIHTIRFDDKKTLTDYKNYAKVYFKYKVISSNHSLKTITVELTPIDSKVELPPKVIYNHKMKDFIYNTKEITFDLSAHPERIIIDRNYYF